MGFIEHTSNPKEPICKGFLNLKPEKRGGQKKLQKKPKKKQKLHHDHVWPADSPQTGWFQRRNRHMAWFWKKRRDIQTSGIASDVSIWKGVIHRSDDPRWSDITTIRYNSRLAAEEQHLHCGLWWSIAIEFEIINGRKLMDKKINFQKKRWKKSISENQGSHLSGGG